MSPTKGGEQMALVDVMRTVSPSMPARRVAESGSNVPFPDLSPTVLDPSDDVGPLVW